MIGRLRGLLIEKQPPHLLLDISGVAYEVETSMNTFYKLPELNQQVTLHIQHIVREDAQLLYGFHEQCERTLFRSLIKVNGVGPKLALAILSSTTPNEFIRCIVDNDSATLVRFPGIGKKTAERLLIEMRDRVKDLQIASAETDALSGTTPVISAQRQAEKEALDALIALGYKPQEASKAVIRVQKEGLSSEEMIRLALQAV